VKKITLEDVERLESLADLELDAERRQAVAGILSVWVPAANELSRKMAEPRFRALTPALQFTKLTPDEGVE